MNLTAVLFFTSALVSLVLGICSVTKKDILITRRGIHLAEQTQCATKQDLVDHCGDKK